MANKVLTIEIGNSITKICEMDYKSKKPMVHQCFHVVTPPGVLDDGVVENNPELINAICQTLESKKIKTKQVVFSVSSNKVANRDVDVPLVKDNKLQSVLASNAQDYFPVDLAQYELSYSKGEEFTDESGIKKIKLQAHAIPKYLVQSYRDLSESCGLSIVGIDLVGNSIANIFENQLTEGIHLVVKIDDVSCFLSVFNGNKVVFQRYVMSGINSTVSELQNAPDFGGKMPYMEALRRFRTMPLLNARLLSREELSNLNKGMIPMDATVSPERVKLTQALEDMVDGITRIIDFYNSQNSQAPIQDVYLTGIGAEFVGMRELLTNEIGKICYITSTYSALTLDKKIANTSVCAYSACLGSGFAPVLAISNKKSKSSGGTPTTIDWSHLALFLFGIGAVASGAMAFLSITAYSTQMDDYNRQVSKYNNLVDTQRLILDYNNAEAAYNDFKQMDNFIGNVHEGFLDLLSEMEWILPSDFWIDSFESDGNQLTLNVKSKSMVSIAGTLQYLRYFDEFQTVYMDNVSSEEDQETQEITYKYSIVCTYVPYGSEKTGSEAFEDAGLQNQIISERDLVMDEITEEGTQATENGTESQTTEDGRATLGQ